jgi:Protein of unknown function (DUF3106)
MSVWGLDRCKTIIGFTGLMVCCFLSARSAPAQPAPSLKPTAPSAASPVMPVSSPRWTELTPEQQLALTPLKKLWPDINQARKRKWLAISRNFHDLPEMEQQKMHERMREWASMTEVERAQARLQYAHAQTLSVDERRQRWEAYQALSPEERQKLAQHRPRKPQGAAIALRPAPRSKIITPVHRPETAAPPAFSALRIDTDQIHPTTLLPLNVPGHASP